MARLIVTGATGFIGRPAVRRAVERGFAVEALCTRLPDDPYPGVRYHAVNLLEDRDRARAVVRDIGASHCLHLAWYAEPRRFWTSRENFQWVGATLDLAEAFAAGGGLRFVGAGTCAEYDWNHGVCREYSTPLEPATPYGIAKDAVRRLLVSWSREAGISAAWGRIFFVYGPGEHRDRLVASVVRALLRGARAPCTEGSQRRDFLHVRDVADAFVTLVGSPYEGAVNIASGEPVEVRALVQRIAAEIGRPDLLDLGALPSPDAPPLVAGDTRLLRETLRCSPHFDLVSGLRDAIRWHRAGAEELLNETDR
jgi:nucleoside-diphosphate-sugar epimerase